MPKPVQVDLAIVLGGGGAKGLSYMPLLEFLDEQFKLLNIKPKLLIGTSMGSLLLALYAVGKLNEFKQELIKSKPKEIRRLFISKPSRYGLTDGKKVEEVLKRFLDDVLIEKLPYKYIAVATDIKTGVEVLITKGVLWRAVRASCSIPGLFVPVKKASMALVDGNIVNPLPVDIAKKHKCRVIAASAMLNPYELEIERIISGKDHFPTIIEVISNAIQISGYWKVKQAMKKADIVLCPEIKIGTLQFYRYEEAFKAGNRVLEKAKKDIIKLLHELKSKAKNKKNKANKINSKK